MHPVIVMFIGTCADMRPIRIIFSPVSGWKAESKTYFAFHSSSSVSPGETIPFLGGGIQHLVHKSHPGAPATPVRLQPGLPVVSDDFVCVC